jgi:flavin-dependent dehydrogenase
MDKENLAVDVVVAGGGTAGSAAAWALARTGLSVMVLERRFIDQAGARWANAVPPWFFDEFGIDRPKAPELQRDEKSAWLISRFGTCRAGMHDPMPYIGVDCRHLVQRLHSLGRDSGVVFEGDVSGATLEIDAHGRPVALTARRGDTKSGGFPFRVAARLFVDASGTSGVLRRQAPAMARDCPPLQPDELCSGANQIRRIADQGGAIAYLAALGLQPGDTVNWAGVMGGFSTLVVHVRSDLQTVLITTGVSQDGGRGSGTGILDDFVASNPWIGSTLFGGAGLIPIRRPFDRLCAPGIALVGDAACQVFPAHASGIGMGLMGARTLADAVAGSDDPGAEGPLWAYQSRFHRRYGAILGGFDAFRRLTVSMTGEDVGALVGEGFMTGDSLRLALSQRLVPPRDAGLLASVVRAAARRPDIAARLVASVARMAATAALYRLHPARPDRSALRRWSCSVAAALGGRPDVL